MYTELMKCPDCGNMKQMQPMKDKRCMDCRANECEIERTKHLVHLSSLSVEQRLAEIEKWMYDHKFKYAHPTFFR